MNIWASNISMKKLLLLKELYNLNEDRTEMHNVADKYPDRLAKMQKQYEEWAKRCMVVPSPK